MQELTTRMPIPVTHPDSLRSRSGSDLLTISVTPAEDFSSSAEIEGLSSEPERYRATRLAVRLGNIVTGSHNDRYWLASGSPAPAPQAFNASHLSPGSIGGLNASNERNAVTRQNDQGNYAHPELDRERWTFEVDNDFAASVLSTRINMQALSAAASSTPRLCKKCAEIHKSLWSPLFRETFTTEKLKQNADAKLCDLCCLFWQACIRNKATEWRVIVFERIDSNLKISGTKSSAISLFRKSGKPATATCTACC
jgi:hypothetical protein